ncbi:homogentisate 1,2-dioxygenase [Anaeromyxobacter paludicola]|uniref:Homogentisate 1,2-dioxygenase n=1 Tax=Anaeromyxobacter paludicola TaxID=2918171 RepID=A0ABM7XEF1_9BACT|nr:homogentisate 1,2-dioxygenase [Anaeromyxobacter paludicola]BDG10236.1 homogentisate 1,2-dioxygenase [Anaeromyxobacter paludicola]
MIARLQMGEVPPKHHLAFRDAEGRLRYEEAFTRQGFDGPYTLAYHVNRPHPSRPLPPPEAFPLPVAVPPRPLLRRHYRSQDLAQPGGPPSRARLPLLFNEDVAISVAAPTAEDPAYFSNGDGDDLWFVAEGGGLLRTALGDLAFGAGDYVLVPRGLLHRFLPGDGPQRWLALELAGGVGLPRQWRNEAGQLRMDAPYSHRDFRAPAFQGPRDEGIRELRVKRGGAFHAYQLERSPLDVVGWDGAVYPVAFQIRDFQPRVGLVHLPPTWHGTFAARGALVCSFVPRPLDFHPQAVPCPYPHASVDVDEVIFYVSGEFTSRRGVGPGSISHHPAGVMHGPHPGAYEASIGQKATSEVAVMLDCYRPLAPTPFALGVEDPGYHESFSE